MSTRRQGLAVAALFVALTVAMTWPLAPRMRTEIAADLGDPLLNAWILAWDATHLGRGLWHANIFHPHPYALAYSEHLVAEAIQMRLFDRRAPKGGAHAEAAA